MIAKGPNIIGTWKDLNVKDSNSSVFPPLFDDEKIT